MAVTQGVRCWQEASSDVLQAGERTAIGESKQVLKQVWTEQVQRVMRSIPLCCLPPGLLDARQFDGAASVK